MSKMSLTRLLNEIKLTEQKVIAGTSKSFTTIKIGSKLPAGYSNEQELTQQIKANYQSAVDLNARRNKLKSLLVVANATTKVTIGKEEMTIAEAIERKRTIELEVRLLQNMQAQYANAQREITQHNTKVEANIDAQLQNLFGKDRKVDQSEADAVAVPYRKQHEATLVDPLNLRTKIEELEERINTFKNEVDFVLSEINARTEVEVNF